VKRVIRRLWRVTTWPERAVTILSPYVVLGAILTGSWREAAAWGIAALWWALYLEKKLTVESLNVEIMLRQHFYRAFVRIVNEAAKERRDKAHAARTESSIRLPRHHR